MSRPTTVLFVCLGNICRSPMAEGVFRHLCDQAGVAEKIVTDSAGTGNWHIGNPPDPRAIQAAAQRNIDISNLRARQVKDEDFLSFDHVFAMDRNNLSTLLSRSPADAPAAIRLFLEPAKLHMNEVPDPYYGGDDGFDPVLELIEAGSAAILQEIMQPKA